MTNKNVFIDGKPAYNSSVLFKIKRYGMGVVYFTVVVSFISVVVYANEMKRQVGIRDEALQHEVSRFRIEARNQLQQALGDIEFSRKIKKDACEKIPKEERTPKEIYYCG